MENTSEGEPQGGITRRVNPARTPPPVPAPSLPSKSDMALKYCIFILELNWTELLRLSRDIRHTSA